MSVLDKLKDFVDDNSSTLLLIGTGITVTATVFEACRATAKAVDHLEDKKTELKKEKLSFKEKLSAVGKDYIWTALGLILVDGELIAIGKTNHDEVLSLINENLTSELLLNEWKEHANDILGDKKTQQIEDKIAEDRVKNDAPIANQQIIFTGAGKYLCKDMLTYKCGDGQWNGYFKSDINEVKSAILYLNDRMLTQLRPISLNDYYEVLHLPYCEYGDDIGWSLDTTGLLKPRFSYVAADSEEPCLAISFSNMPTQEFRENDI